MHNFEPDPAALVEQKLEKRINALERAMAQHTAMIKQLQDKMLQVVDMLKLVAATRK